MMAYQESWDDRIDQEILRLSKLVREAGDDGDAATIIELNQHGEWMVGLYLALVCLANDAIPVPHDDYEFLQQTFCYHDDPNWDPMIDTPFFDDEDELFHKLKLADE